MDSHKVNLIFGSVMATALVIQTVRIGAEMLYETPEPEKAGYAVPGAETPAAPAAPAADSAKAEENLPDFAAAIPAADVMAGEMIAERCGACHDWMKGGPNKIGPNLYGVVGRKRASAEGFTYSPIMQSQGGNWTYANLYTFLERPAIVMPGTKMTFAGLPKMEDRINVIAFLRNQADMPEPLPAAGAPAAP